MLDHGPTMNARPLLRRRAIDAYAGLGRLAAAIPASLPLLMLRVAVAIPFLKSGLLKWDGPFRLSETAVYLFQSEFKLHILGQTYAYPAPALMALLSATGEVVFSTMLILGLGARIAALGMLGMTAVIQLTVPEGWANFHLAWAAMLLAILRFGPGRISADHLIGRLNR
jgi:putative oxidoreductase